jgi:hypothetical protein
MCLAIPREVWQKFSVQWEAAKSDRARDAVFDLMERDAARAAITTVLQKAAEAARLERAATTVVAQLKRLVAGEPDDEPADDEPAPPQPAQPEPEPEAAPEEPTAATRELIGA